MSLLKVEIDQFVSQCSGADLRIVMGELAKKMIAENGETKTFTISDADNNAVAVVLPETLIANPDPSDLQSLMAVARYRRENPPEKYLTIDEFIARLSCESI